MFDCLLPYHRFLGHLYAAEALIKQNRLPEAIMHLSPENIININIIPASTSAEGIYLICKVLVVNIRAAAHPPLP